MSIVDACGSENGRGDVDVVWRLVDWDVSEERRVVLEDVFHGVAVGGSLDSGELGGSLLEVIYYIHIRKA